jgi:hypothetical protein
MNTSRKRMRRECEVVSCRHCEPTGRANARPMTGCAKQSSFLFLRRQSWIASLALAMTVFGCLKIEIATLNRLGVVHLVDDYLLLLLIDH